MPIDAMKRLIETLHLHNCSLVVQSTTSELTTYFKIGVRDLIFLLDNITFKEEKKTMIIPRPCHETHDNIQRRKKSNERCG